MRSSGTRALVALGFSFLLALTAACGGSAPEAKAPGVDATDTPRVGSNPLDLPSDAASGATTTAATPEPPKTSAVSSTDNGSDIIPPFTSGKDPATKKGAPASPSKGSKKTAGKKPKKKAAGA